MDSAPFYNGRSYGLVYACVDCDAYVGVHRGTETAKGRLADAELRRWKIKAHSSFDALWRRAIDKGRTKHEARTSAYKWLSLELGLPPEHTHIGMFDIDLCKQVVKTCRQYL